MSHQNSAETLKLYSSKFTRPSKKSPGLESTTATTEGATEQLDVKQRLERAKEGIRKIAESQTNANGGIKELSERVLKESYEPLQALEDWNAQYFDEHPEKLSLLEVIVRTDGSRPSFLIKKDEVDLTSGEVGQWSGAFTNAKDTLKTAIQSVGRINIGAIHVGTGYLVSKNLIITNRHVLQAVATQDSQRRWSFVKGAHIDFGFEFKTRLSVNPRKLLKVVFCDPREIDRYNIDHNKLDLAIIEVGEGDENYTPKNVLQVESSKTWAFPDSAMFTIGYPADPGQDGIDNYGASVLYNLFRDSYGCKRIAPGKIMPHTGDVGWMISHDASTLGGNSGSVIVSRPNEDIAAGLHYGGDLATPRQNWGHDLAFVFDALKTSNPSVYQQLTQHIQLP